MTEEWITPCIPDSHLYKVTNSRHRIGTVFSPDDGNIVARNMYRKAINILSKFLHQVGSIYKRNVYIRRVYICPFTRRLRNTPLFPVLWKSSPSSESSLTLHPAEYCGQTEKWLLIFQKIGRTYTQKNEGEKKSDEKRMGRNMIWGGYVHGLSINIFVRLHPTIHK